MDHTSVPDPVGFAELSTDEQIRYPQALWDRVVDSGCDIPVPEAALSIAVERLAEFREDPKRATSPYSVLDRLGQRRE